MIGGTKPIRLFACCGCVRYCGDKWLSEEEGLEETQEELLEDAEEEEIRVREFIARLMHPPQLSRFPRSLSLHLLLC